MGTYLLTKVKSEVKVAVGTYLLTKVRKSGSGDIFVNEGEVKWQWGHIC